MIQKEVLEVHLDNKLNMSEIARMYNVSSSSVKKWMKKYGLYKRTMAYNGHNVKKIERKHIICINCGVKVYGNHINVQKYCSQKCQHEYQYKTFIENWKNGKELGGNGFAVCRHVRNYLFDKFENKCCKCGWCQVNEFTGNIPLEVDHVDGNPLNHTEENLELICPNCHSLTKSAKGANRGNGRYDRMKRYNSSKSY